MPGRFFAAFILILTATLFYLLTIHFTPQLTIAQERIESDNYRIQFPNFNSGAGVPSSNGYILDSTIGQTAAGLFSSNGFRVKSGFEYIHSIIPFSFTISSIQINFGTLTPQTPTSDASTLTVSSGGAGGYLVTVAESSPLTSASNTIPDTTCDSGSCSQTTAGVWNQNTTYGFGYNMSGDDIPAAFTDSTYFKQFADLSLSESPQIVMSSSNVGGSRQATITYKVNISPVQPQGTYKNIVTFSAVPGY